MRYGLPTACNLLFCAGLAVALSLNVSSARAQVSSPDAATYPFPSAASDSAQKAAPTRGADRHKAWSVNDEPYIGHGAPQWRYFVEFRARNAVSYGHMYVMYGEVNSRHEIVKSEVAGFFPAGDERDCVNCSVYNWTIGHVLPVPSEIGASDGDLEEQYVLARFRVWVDAQQYQSLVAYINKRKAHKGPWNAFFANCVTFGRDVASFLKVKMPPLLAFSPSVVMYPKDVVDSMREANGLKHEQAPLRDAGGKPPIRVGTAGRHASKTGATQLSSSTTKKMANRAAGQLADGKTH